MSTLSRPVSSSDPPSPPLARPSSSSSSSSSSSGSCRTDSFSVRVADVSLQVEVVRGDDPTNVVDRSDSPLQGVPLVDLSWVDPKVVGISSAYSTEAFVSKFLDKCPVLKADGHSSFFSVHPCPSIESVCMGRPGIDPPFFYLYVYLFPDLHVSLPFDEFTMGVLWSLYVDPTQIHPNTWASIQAFRLLCDVLRLHLSPSSFLSYYTSHPTQPVPWHSLIGRSGSVLFNS